MECANILTVFEYFYTDPTIMYSIFAHTQE